MDDHIERLRAVVAAEAEAAVELRRAIHRRPELGHTEFETTATVVSHLRAAGLEPDVRESEIGLTIDIGDSEPRIAFRADLDALPIHETSGAEYSSENPGIMHACGHDAHTAIAAGIARALAATDLPAGIRFIFQPAEECVPGGAVAMARDGVVDGLEAIVAFHVDPSTPVGTIGLRRGPITSAADRVRIRFEGPGGHTSRPHLTTDLVYAAAKVVTDLPLLVQHRADPRDPVALVFGTITGGTAENVIPTSIDVAGTVRMFDAELWRGMPPLIEKLVAEITAPLGATASVDYQRGAPPVVNDARVVDIVQRAAGRVLGPDGLLPTEQSLGAEDFAWFLEEIPGALIRLGAATPGRTVDLHAADFDIDERSIAIGMLVGAAALLELLDAQ